MSRAVGVHHILLVEDDPEDTRIITRALESSSKIRFELHIAEDGVVAIDYLYQRNVFSPATAPRPSLILLDLILPRIDGRAVLKELKRSADFRSIPVVVLTTSSNQDEINECYELGVNSFVAKPENYESFAQIVQDLERYWLRMVALPEEE